MGAINQIRFYLKVLGKKLNRVAVVSLNSAHFRGGNDNGIGLLNCKKLEYSFPIK
jgi:hypothetical protein